MIARLRRLLVLAVVAGAAYVAYRYYSRPPTELVLTGIVTTNDVVVSPQIGGKLEQLLVTEGDAVTRGQKIGVIAPAELQADSMYAMHTAEGLASQIQEAEAALRYQERQTAEQIRHAESTRASIEAQAVSASADLEKARLAFDRVTRLSTQGVAATSELDEARTARMAAEGRLDAIKRQLDAQAATIALARSTAEQVSVRRSQLRMNQQQQAAATAQRAKADVRLGYTDITAPIDGTINVRAARAGEVVNAGQPLVTIVNHDDLWVRADVEETYVDRLRIGDRFQVRLPSGDARSCAVFFRGADAGFATQRDVSRTKRDIRTFEIRLRCDNQDRRLALGMTAYVLLPLS